MRNKLVAVTVVLLVAVAAAAVGRWTVVGRESQFVVGGALVDAGYGLQDGLESYDFEHHHDITPEQVWDEVLKQNRLSSGMRQTFPRTALLANVSETPSPARFSVEGRRLRPRDRSTAERFHSAPGREPGA